MLVELLLSAVLGFTLLVLLLPLPLPPVMLLLGLRRDTVVMIKTRKNR